MTSDRSSFREGLAALIGTSRPVSWINTAYPFAAAYLMVGGGVTAELLVGTLWFLIPYNLLMYGVNDVFDYESDLRNPRKGGIEGVVLSTRWHRLTLQASVISNLPFIIALIIMGNTLSTIILAVSVFAVVAYSARGLRFKEKPVLDSATSATHFVSPAVFGIALAEADFTTPIIYALVAFFLWGMASQAFGAVQDIQADRDGGIASVATWLGAKTTVRGAAAAYVLAGLLLLGTGWPGALSALLVVPYIVNVAPYLNLSDEECERANAAWRRFIWLNLLTGFLVTQLFIWIALAF
ncbi:prenyltransferase [Flaviflexus huanghaiensis]|uniref:prenyltransferase n=1 Tax=Flaviflexus huanghaiensis TaxID=1111473 RepID=UPI0015FC04D9|nr:prenyltransferase [Flaviflexus huanghaiensis]